MQQTLVSNAGFLVNLWNAYELPQRATPEKHVATFAKVTRNVPVCLYSAQYIWSRRMNVRGIDPQLPKPPPTAEFAAEFRNFCPPKILRKKYEYSNNKLKSTLQ